MTKQLRFAPFFVDLIQGVPVRRVIIVMMTCPDLVTRHSAWLSIRYDTSSFRSLMGSTRL